MFSFRILLLLLPSREAVVWLWIDCFKWRWSYNVKKMLFSTKNMLLLNFFKMWHFKRIFTTRFLKKLTKFLVSQNDNKRQIPKGKMIYWCDESYIFVLKMKAIIYWVKSIFKNRIFWSNTKKPIQRGGL